MLRKSEETRIPGTATMYYTWEAPRAGWELPTRVFELAHLVVDQGDGTLAVANTRTDARSYMENVYQPGMVVRKNRNGPVGQVLP